MITVLLHPESILDADIGFNHICESISRKHIFVKASPGYVVKSSILPGPKIATKNCCSCVVLALKQNRVNP